MMCKVCGCDKYNKIGEIKGIWEKIKMFINAKNVCYTLSNLRAMKKFIYYIKTNIIAE